MDPATLALTAAGLLAGKALEAVGGKVGEGVSAALVRLADVVRRRFRASPADSEVLERLEAKPDSQGRTQELAEVLQAHFTAAPDFAAEVAQIIQAAKSEPQTASFVTTVEDNARVGKITNIGQVAGDVNID